MKSPPSAAAHRRAPPPMSPLATLQHLALHPSHTLPLCTLLLLADSLLCSLIITSIPYTEIDWATYMQQISLFHSGELNYRKLHGDTGPLVYPAAHVWIYSGLSRLTDGGADVRLAQWLFAAVYLLTLGVTMGSYKLAGAPLYVYPLLVMSRRLHSIYALRLFNDCWAMLFFAVALFAYQKKSRLLAALAYSVGLGTKMNLLLALPAVAMVLLLDVGFVDACGDLLNVLLVQVLLATPFLRTDYMSYLTRAFDFSRVFLFKWSVNWTFLGQDVFLSKAFASSLLLAHFSLLLLFIHTRWLRPSGKTLLDLPSLLLSSRSPAYQKRVSSQVTPRFIALTFYASIVIGMLCARSLHYQFFSWLAWGTPFLLWQSSFPPQLQIVIWAVQEYAWNVYPSTPQSSAMIVGCLATILYGVFTKRDTGSTIAKASTIKDSIEPNSSAALNKRNMTKPSRSR